MNDSSDNERQQQYQDTLSIQRFFVHHQGRTAWTARSPHVIRLVGKTSHARIYKVRGDKDQREGYSRNVAVKIMTRTRDEDKAQISRELRIHRELRHPHIIGCYDAGKSKNHWFLVLEYAANLDLYELLMASTPPSQAYAITITRQILRALKYCHRRHIVHRDVKPENIFILKDGTAKLGDFGWSVLLEGEGRMLSDCCCGTLGYNAPEMAGDSPQYDEKVDVWGIGLVFYELLIGQEASKHGNGEIVLCFDQGTWTRARDAVCQALERNPRERPSCKELLKMECFAKK